MAVMDTKERLQYQLSVEEYLEGHQVYDLFEGLMKDLLVELPDDPVSYLISKLERDTEVRRLFLIGGVGTGKKRIGRELAERFALEFVSVGELLQAEVQKGSEPGREIVNCWKSGLYVPDQVVIDILFPHLEQLSQRQRKQKKETGYILEGFPRTRVQALALQSSGIVPEKVIQIITPKSTFTANFPEKYISLVGEQPPASISAACESAFLECDYHSKGIPEVYRLQHQAIEGDPDPASTMEKVAKLVLVRGRTGAPRKPPRVLVLGPPGSGRSTQAVNLAQRYGLVYVSSSQLLKDQAQRRTELGRQIAHLMQLGDLIPDQILIDLLHARLTQTDCKVNGWVADGYPKTYEQAKALKAAGLAPTHVFFLQASDAVVYERMDGKRLDPVTGEYYGPSNLPDKTEVLDRLIQSPEDSHDVIRKRLDNYKQSYTKLRTEYRTISAEVRGDLPAAKLTELLGDAIENSISAVFDS